MRILFTSLTLISCLACSTPGASAEPLTCEGVSPIGDPEAPAGFDIIDGRAVMTGTIGSTTPDVVRALRAENPEVRIIVMPEVPGSEDDDANLVASRLVRDLGFDTCVPSTGTVASGGTDFFLAGNRRSAANGARIGVHSWSGPEGQGSDLDRDDMEHDKYLAYYEDLGIDPEFYWFTLEAAPSDGMHYMTRAEIERWGVESD